jgi:hypothetical protein
VGRPVRRRPPRLHSGTARPISAIRTAGRSVLGSSEAIPPSLGPLPENGRPRSSPAGPREMDMVAETYRRSWEQRRKGRVHPDRVRSGCASRVAELRRQSARVLLPFGRAGIPGNVQFGNATRIPVPDQSAACVFASHEDEHLARQDVPKALREPTASRSGCGRGTQHGERRVHARHGAGRFRIKPRAARETQAIFRSLSPRMDVG